MGPNALDLETNLYHLNNSNFCPGPTWTAGVIVERLRPLTYHIASSYKMFEGQNLHGFCSFCLNHEFSHEFSHEFQSVLALVDIVLIQTWKFFPWILTWWPNHKSFVPLKFCTITTVFGSSHIWSVLEKTHWGDLWINVVHPHLIFLFNLTLFLLAS